MGTDDTAEEALTGGNASAEVVRVGDTVRKPWLPTSARTVAYLEALRTRGLDVPRTHGRDERGRLVLDFVPGDLAMHHGPLDPVLLGRVGALVRRIHDASEGLPVPDDWEVLLPADHPDLLCHNDLAAWNLVIDGDRLVFIDWDGSGPSTRLWDLAYAAVSFGHLFAGEDPDAAAARLAAFVDGYGADGPLRAALPLTMARRAGAMRDLLLRSHATGREPWASMHTAGHGAHWRDATAWVARHEALWAGALGSGPGSTGW
ncbi:phosphotransferase [Phycicoccus sonneratiae]|uniref:Phosphotransferase n=1 Tax=Phycicoccus sonneratiae TaxID=2807628 RepID=A0ABS2CL16_9MICO|nr:phosphotransferase [Phycicoccus sonneraticus]MBM6400578.1 phosphotransferase [Phycicoccus sonneraticus]